MVRLVPLWAPIKRISIVSNPLLQAPDMVFEGSDDGLVEDLLLPNGRYQAFGNPVEGDAVHVIALKDVAH